MIALQYPRGLKAGCACGESHRLLTRNSAEMQIVKFIASFAVLFSLAVATPSAFKADGVVEGNTDTHKPL